MVLAQLSLRTNSTQPAQKLHVFMVTVMGSFHQFCKSGQPSDMQ
jgi:hypothetical protein